MFPIRDHNPSGRTPYVVYALMAANILIFISYVGIMNDTPLINRFYFDYAIIPARISDGVAYETFVTSMFLHGGWMHLAGNMLFLWIFGDNLEDEMGHVPFLLFYLVAGIGAGLIHVITAPGSVVPTIGASGAIAGVMGGYLLLFPKARVDILLILIIYFRVFTIPAFVMLGVWLGMQFFGSLTSNPDQGGVAYWAHTGGFVVGLILCIPLWLKRGGPGYWNRTHGHPPHPEHTYKRTQSRIPRIPRR
ncbi:rhomboid family intramembrane serine protease [Rhodobacteraceae bacterium B1Z28]|uniref:Rhomboid family intramembrane serine protease n=1 Tax=Ruegeria haliotis TaxID=2747601 RepID=A0ABX2PK03_9RHOB|nr:rhomboid family intramembrane serine protease [Ruegeria haliotis]NVO54445.1 rhomboid family intramembrane serine protease [Ruegeria haliotis]